VSLAGAWDVERLNTVDGAALVAAGIVHFTSVAALVGCWVEAGSGLSDWALADVEKLWVFGLDTAELVEWAVTIGNGSQLSIVGDAWAAITDSSNSLCGAVAASLGGSLNTSTSAAALEVGVDAATNLESQSSLAALSVTLELSYLECGQTKTRVDLCVDCVGVGCT